MATKSDPRFEGTYYRTDGYISNQGGFVALFLRPEGRFLFKVVWPFYEFSTITGTWTTRGPEVYLRGRRTGWTDVIDLDAAAAEPEVFEMTLERDDPRRALSIRRKGPRAGIFGMGGPYVFLGDEVIEGPSGEALAESIEEIDEEIATRSPELEEARG